jgi:hypothetical protein
MTSSGHVRLAGQNHTPNAVQWWYFRDYEDGWAFARGGRCRTTREARHLIRAASRACAVERHYFENRPEREMLNDGSLIPVRGRSPYEAVR